DVALDAEAVTARIQQVRIARDVKTGIVAVVREEVAAKEARVRCGLQVDTSNRLLFGAVVRNRERVSTAPVRVVGGISHRKQLEQLQRKRTEERRIHLVVDERKSELLCGATATGR